MVEQVVSTRSGSIVYSTTAFAKTYADAVGPADALRQAILRHAGRGLAFLDAPPPTASPEPIANAGGVNISKAFGRHHKGATAPAASAASAQPQAVTASAAPAPAVAQVALGLPAGPKALVATTEGTADATARAYASLSLGSALRHAGVTNERLMVSSADIAAHAADLCKANAAGGFYAATLAVAGAGTTVQLDVAAYDCHGAVTGRQQASGSAGKHGSLERAIDAASARVASGFATARGPATRATPRATT